MKNFFKKIVPDKPVVPPTPVAPPSPFGKSVPDALKQFPWMVWLYSNYGQPEITGKKATDFDKLIFSHTSYGELVNGIMDEGCAATACAALEINGYKSPHNAMAISFRKYGTECEIKPGCILVFEWASGGHHVTFCDHVVDNQYVAATGGNQSSKLQTSTFARKYIIASRWPVKA